MTTDTATPTFLCPRRIETPAHFNRLLPESDHWRPDGTWSYCGSLSPAKFFEAVEAGCQLGPTDKSYKVYVDLPHPDPKGMRVVSAITFEPDTGAGSGGWEKVTDENRHLLAESGWRGTSYIYIRRCENGPKIQAKFYFQHLSEAERDRFIELHNAGKLNLGFPGHFYVTPFFCTRRVAAPATAE